MNCEHRCRNKSIPFLLTDIGGQYIQTCSTLGISSNNLFTNLERLGAYDLLSYGQLSYDTILTSIQSNNASPLPVNVSLKKEILFLKNKIFVFKRVYLIVYFLVMVLI
jgi:hypothetical protein